MKWKRQDAKKIIDFFIVKIMYIFVLLKVYDLTLNGFPIMSLNYFPFKKMLPNLAK